MQKKSFYKISDITESLGISPRTIRYYDQYGLLPHVKRSKGNIRLFDESDIELIKQIRLLQKTKGLPLEDIKKYLIGPTNSKAKGSKCIVFEEKSKLNIISNYKDSEYKCMSNSLVIGDKSFVFSDELSVSNMWEVSSSLEAPIIEKEPDENVIKYFLENALVNVDDELYVISSSYDNPIYFKCLSKVIENMLIQEKKIQLIDTQSLCVAQGLFVYLLLEAFQANRSKQEIDILIRKYSKSSFSFILSTQLSCLYGSRMKNFSENDTNPLRNAVLSQVNQLKPIFKYDSFKSSLSFNGAFQSTKQALMCLYNAFAEHFDEQGRYAQCISISSHALTEETQELERMIRQLHASVPIDITEMNPYATAQFGENALVLSVI